MATMTFADVMSDLEAVRSENIAIIFSRRNPAAKTMGVRFGDMAKIAKKIKKQTPLALELWETGIAEPRILAIRAIDPKDVTPELADRWARETDFPIIADEWAGVVYKTPYALEKMEAWTQSQDEFVRRAGFSLLFRFAADPKQDQVSDERFREYLGQIEREIHDSPNWSREMMNLVPVAIGLRSPKLHEAALATARAYTPISVFHGDKTNCKVNNAVEDLLNPRTKVHV
jgi:3-methyladenine DNA glycosylase AlkD